MSCSSEDDVKSIPTALNEVAVLECCSTDDEMDPLLHELLNDDSEGEAYSYSIEIQPRKCARQSDSPYNNASKNRKSDSLSSSKALAKVIKHETSSSDSEAHKKRSRDPSSWKQNIRIKRRNAGLPYINAMGDEVPGKAMGPTCATTCYLSCRTKITDQQRGIIYSNFWKFTAEDKHLFIANFVEKVPLKRRKKNYKNEDLSRKQATFKYHFSVANKRIQVCKTYFLNTLGISERRIYYYFKNCADVGSKSEEKPKRGRKPTDADRIEKVKEHIASFPTFENYSCCSTTAKTYLDSSLSVQKMYDIYTLEEDNPVSIDIYRKTFKTAFNLSFYLPSKEDRCAECELSKRSVKYPTTKACMKLTSKSSRLD